MDTAIQKQLVAVRAVIVKEGQVLVIRESGQYEEGTNLGKYDFPGGRVGLGENIFEALKRETEEECGLKIKTAEPFFVDEWRPVIKGEPVQIVGIFFKCEILDGSEVKLSSDHDDFQWISISGSPALPLMAENLRALEALT